MTRRTTIEIDEALLDRAMQALGCTTTRATIEEALRRAADLAVDQAERLAAAQNGCLDRLETRVGPASSARMRCGGDRLEFSTRALPHGLTSRRSGRSCESWPERSLSAPWELERLYSARSASGYDALAAELGATFPRAEAPGDVFDRALVLQRDLAHHHGRWHRTAIPDLLISETALHNGLGVVHVDRGFERIAEVRPLRCRRLRGA